MPHPPLEVLDALRRFYDEVAQYNGRAIRPQPADILTDSDASGFGGGVRRVLSISHWYNFCRLIMSPPQSPRPPLLRSRTLQFRAPRNPPATPAPRAAPLLLPPLPPSVVASACSTCSGGPQGPGRHPKARPYRNPSSASYAPGRPYVAPRYPRYPALGRPVTGGTLPGLGGRESRLIPAASAAAPRRQTGDQREACAERFWRVSAILLSEGQLEFLVIYSCRNGVRLYRFTERTFHDLPLRSAELRSGPILIIMALEEGGEVPPEPSSPSADGTGGDLKCAFDAAVW
eukprot:COSAG01_NODE_1936_length_8861_cov_27.526364_2_plen_288_part_00